VDLLVWSLAIQASRTIDAYPTPVLKVDHLTGRGSPGLVVRELIYDRNNPAMLFHCALVSEGLGAVDVAKRGIRIAYVLTRHPPVSVLLTDAERLSE
jgi:hypothetical protein